MAFALAARARENGYRLAPYDTIGSTNAEALVRGRAGDPGKLWVVSDRQTAGRGRRGRAWQTPPGNLAATLLLVDAHSALPPTFGFVAGLAVVNAIGTCATASAFPSLLPPLPLWERVAPERARGSGEGGSVSAALPLTPRSADRSDSGVRRERRKPFDVRLKWPNDVLLGGAKVAGILLEATNLPGGGNALAVGIGVNVAHAPEGLPYPVTSLAAAGIRATAEDFFSALSEAWLEDYAPWDSGRGFDRIRERWLARAAGLGEAIAVAARERTIRGVFETIDGDGRLIVRCPDGTRRTISAGDVHFGAAATLVEA